MFWSSFREPVPSRFSQSMLAYCVPQTLPLLQAMPRRTKGVSVKIQRRTRQRSKSMFLCCAVSFVAPPRKHRSMKQRTTFRSERKLDLTPGLGLHCKMLIYHKEVLCGQEVRARRVVAVQWLYL